MERCFFSQAAAAAYLKVHKRTFQRLLAGGVLPPADFDLGGNSKAKRQGWRASTLARVLGECQRRRRYAPLSNKCVAKRGHIGPDDCSPSNQENKES